MARSKTRAELEQEYAQAAQEYVASLPPERLPDTARQGEQRSIVLASLAVIRTHRPDLRYYNKLAVRYRSPGAEIRRVVPDNLVVLHEGELVVTGSYDLWRQPVRPLWALDYLSRIRRPELHAGKLAGYAELGMRSALSFHVEDGTLTLYRLTRAGYVSINSVGDGRYAIEEIDTTVGLLGGWVRFWFRGELVPLTEDLDARVRELTRSLTDKDAEIARLQAQLKQLRGE